MYSRLRPEVRLCTPPTPHFIYWSDKKEVESVLLQIIFIVFRYSIEESSFFVDIFYNEDQDISQKH